VAYKKFRENPEANPLKTPSGKIEIYSSKLAEIAATWELEKDETISPLPVYASTFDGWDAPERAQFPLQLFGFHFKAYPLELRQRRRAESGLGRRYGLTRSMLKTRH
jgi:Tat-targeted selenate reductase subunit YnfE